MYNLQWGASGPRLASLKGNAANSRVFQVVCISYIEGRRTQKTSKGPSARALRMLPATWAAGVRGMKRTSPKALTRAMCCGTQTVGSPNMRTRILGVSAEVAEVILL